MEEHDPELQKLGYIQGDDTGDQGSFCTKPTPPNSSSYSSLLPCHGRGRRFEGDLLKIPPAVLLKPRFPQNCSVPLRCATSKNR